MSKLFKGTFVQLSNVRRKFAISTNFDSWFTYSVHSQQNTVSVEFVFWTLWLGKFWIWASKIAFNPPFLTTPIEQFCFNNWNFGAKNKKITSLPRFHNIIVENFLVKTLPTLRTFLTKLWHAIFYGFDPSLFIVSWSNGRERRGTSNSWKQHF